MLTTERRFAVSEHNTSVGPRFFLTPLLADHYLIKPTIDRTFKAGELSTISDHKDNIHWFEALSDSGFVFNLHVIDYDPSLKGGSGRLYLDPLGEKVVGGLTRARKLTDEECHRKFG